MSYFIYDSRGYVGDLCSNNGLNELKKEIGHLLPFANLFEDGHIEVDEKLTNALSKLTDKRLANFKTLLSKCEDIVIITDGMFEDAEEKAVKKKISEQDKRAYWNAYIEKTLKHEARFKSVISKLWDIQEEKIVAQVEQGATEVDPEDDNDEFENTLKPVIGATFEDSFENPPVRPNHRKQWEGLSEDAYEWISTRALTLAKMVNGTSKEDLMRILAKGYSEGLGIPQITKSIKEYYEGARKGRAEMVARTETISASNEGALQRYSRDGLEEVEWIVARDDVLCEICEPYEGERFAVVEASGMIPVHPNCRCVWIPVVEVEE